MKNKNSNCRYVVVRVYKEKSENMLGFPFTRTMTEEIGCKTIEDANGMFSCLSTEEIRNGSYILDKSNGHKIIPNVNSENDHEDKTVYREGQERIRKSVPMRP